MNAKFNFKKLLVILFSISLLLLLAHLVLSFFYSDTKLQLVSTLSDEQINKKFKECLYSFAIKDEWIKAVKDNSSIAYYRVNVPSDLPIPQILGELIKQYDGYNIEVKAEEKKIRGNTLMQLTSDRDIKLKAEFRINSDIERTGSKAAIFIYGRENKEAEYDSLMVTTTRDMSALLIPSKSNSVYSKWLKDNGFDYAVMLNNDINDLEFKLNDDYSEKRLKLIVQNLVVAFPNALFYAIDKNSNIYNSSKYAVIKKEFNKRKIRFFTTDSVKFIDNNQQNISERLNYIVKNIKEGDITRIAISFDVYQTLTDDLKKLIRIGYKFVKSAKLESTEEK
jgi:hypothetical protein